MEAAWVSHQPLSSNFRTLKEGSSRSLSHSLELEADGGIEEVHEDCNQKAVLSMIFRERSWANPAHTVSEHSSTGHVKLLRSHDAMRGLLGLQRDAEYGPNMRSVLATETVWHQGRALTQNRQPSSRPKQDCQHRGQRQEHECDLRESCMSVL